MPFFIVLLSGLLAIVPAHDFHISLTSLNYNRNNQSFELTIKAYTDDFELAVEQHSGKLLKLGTLDQPDDADDIILDYVNSVFKLEVNGEKQSLDYIGFEIDTEAVWFYAEITNLKKVQSVEIRNSLLLKEFEDQQNFVHLKVNNEKRSMLLTKSSPKDKVMF